MRRTTAAVLIVAGLLFAEAMAARPAKPPIIDPSIFGLKQIYTAAVANNPECVGFRPGTEAGGVEIPSPTSQSARSRVFDPELRPPEESKHLLRQAPLPQRAAAHGGYSVSIAGQYLTMEGPTRESNLALFEVFGSSKPFGGNFEARVVWDPWAERFLMVILTTKSPPPAGSLWLLASDDADPFGWWFGGRVGVYGPTRGLSHVAVSDGLIVVVGQPENGASAPYWVVRSGESGGLYDGGGLRVELFDCGIHP